MSEGVPSVSTTDIGIASGFLGAGVGYVLAPRKYDLEQLFTQPDDIFEKIVPQKNLAKQGKPTQKAYQKILAARESYMEALQHNHGDVKLAELTRAPELQKAYKAVENLIPKARSQAAVFFGIVSSFVAMAICYITSPRD